MCVMCSSLSNVCRKLFGCAQGSGRGGKRPETFLTPYEMELLPLMLKELDKVNSRFYQMVCYRWLQNPQSTTAIMRAKRSSTSTSTTTTTSDNVAATVAATDSVAKGPSSLEEFYSEATALKELIRYLAKTLLEKGTFDDACESRLIEYRLRREHWRWRGNGKPPPSTVSQKCGKSQKVTATFPPPLLRRSTFAGSPRDTMDSGVGGTSSTSKTSSATSSGNSSASSSGNGRGGPMPTTAEEEMTPNQQSKCERKSRGARPWLRNHRERAASVRGRRALAAGGDSLFMDLGEELLSEFHSTVYGHPKEFDVHEREMKVLVWRHFTQMLVAVLNDRERFPV